MRKIILELLMVLVVFIFLVGCQSDEKQEAGKQNVDSASVVPESKVVEKTGKSMQIAVKDFKFNPVTLEINVGDTVEWVNNEQSVPHTVTFNDNFYDEKLSVGATATRVFNEKGTFTYYCALHPNMQATVVVN